MIRPETPDDYARIRAIHAGAFPQPLEAQLVEDLRAAGDHVPELCLVHPHGHVMTSKARVDDHPALALGPIAVDTTYQRQGIGSELIRAVIERAQHTDYTLIGLLGHPTYYPRFGFRPGAELGIESTYDAPSEAWMVLPLPAYTDDVRGTFHYAPAFP
ncbi:N-acetyltransferase [Solirubrobacter sp. CPCC 204708]|uniref:N-acetyltransferase n=1 Tax=Solirubrobacter deserti TaxID=2282478 RepID=A0ABT4RKT8_9ACTN|nr:N-acetyltransferase [Solirubrobacter deserti]MBE2319095.1 N-acetyltransferase [Solirubrobacter deserti]MDA0139174.1 N-acetyltransferase [Solirubrobacter deserti]